MCLAVPGQVIAINREGEFGNSGLIDFDGVRLTVNLVFVPEVKVGDYVIVHVGFAISCLNEAEAAKTLAYLQELNRL